MFSFLCSGWSHLHTLLISIKEMKIAFKSFSRRSIISQLFETGVSPSGLWRWKLLLSCNWQTGISALITSRALKKTMIDWVEENVLPPAEKPFSVVMFFPISWHVNKTLFVIGKGVATQPCLFLKHERENIFIGWSVIITSKQRSITCSALR